MEIRSSLIAIVATASFSISLASCSKSDNDLAAATNGLADNKMANTLAGENWKTVKAQNFTIEIPREWNYLPLLGMDGYNGMFSNINDSLRYEYSISSDTFKVDPARYSYHYEVIDGKRAKIISGEGYGIAIDDMEDPSKPQRRFVMMQSSKSKIDEALALRLIRSIRFQ